MTGSEPVPTVLVGVDDTAHTWHAADWAAGEAALRGGLLRIVHATGTGAPDPRSPREDDDAEGAADSVEGLLTHARARVLAGYPGLLVDTLLVSGRTAPEALLAAGRDAGLIVVGTRGRGGFSGLLLGSVSLKVAAHADRPVVVVRGDTRHAAGRPVLAGVRDERDEDAVRFALGEAELRGAPVRLLHAWMPPARSGLTVPQVSSLDDESRAHALVLEHASRPVTEYPGVQVGTDLLVGSPAAALVEASARAGLVVLPRHPVEGRLGLRLGSVVHAVLHHAGCPVAVVPVR
ncbi:universal stress protein [Streptomyces griseosporeus]|uniref:universal stress protein n=1 Tax=Streptomyces griseosporeus TaxID=1910 RepID=UPI0036FBECDA